MADGTFCCSPAIGDAPQQTTATPNHDHGRGNTLAKARAVTIPGGIGLIGAARAELPDDGESPLRRGKLAPFKMSPTTVTNAEFAAFTQATSYVTEAETLGWSFVFQAQVSAALGPTQAVAAAQWWRRVGGATWRLINGPGSDNAWLPDHPVVQVSWRDANAYAAWVGGRLPSEAEWEHAARGGLGDVRYPWGNAEPDDRTHFPCNIWQGKFPDRNTCLDGYASTAPSQFFAPNGYGLYNMSGNVWEWTAEPFRIRSLKKAVAQRMAGMAGYKLLKGGSFLCHRSYCYRYRIAARTGNSPDSTTTHQGFRIVWDAT